MNHLHVSRMDLAVALDMSRFQVRYREKHWGLDKCRVKLKNNSIVLYRLAEVIVIFRALGFDVSRLQRLGYRGHQNN